MNANERKFRLDRHSSPFAFIRVHLRPGILLWALLAAAPVRAADPPALAVALSPDGKRVAAGAGTAVRVWDVASGTVVKELAGHPEAVHSLQFSPDGALLAAGGDRVVKLWNA